MRTRKISKSVAGIFILCLLGQSLFAQARPSTPTPIHEAWQPLFDGNTLNGWKASAPGFFSVEDQAITGKATRKNRDAAPFLIWQGGTVADFRLRFRVRLHDRMSHAGFHFRVQSDGQTLADGYQADVSGFFEGLVGKRPFERFAECGQSNLMPLTGDKLITYFGEPHELITARDVSQWMDYEVLAQGAHILLEINGRKVAELIDRTKSKASQPGLLAISLAPFSEMEVQFKDLELKRLTPLLTDSPECLQAVEIITQANTIMRELRAGSPATALALLKQNPALVNVPSESKMTPLHAAAQRGHVETITWLLAQGAKVNAISFNDFIPLHLARDGETAKLLIQAGAELAADSTFGLTPLQFAAQEKRLGVVEAILATGFKLDILSAIKLGDSAAVAKIIQDDPAAVHGAKVEPHLAGFSRAFPPLLEAVWRKDQKIVELLLNAGADIHTTVPNPAISGPPRCSKLTALAIAVSRQDLRLTEFLLERGAKPEVECASEFAGQTLLEFARFRLKPDIVKLLESRLGIHND